MTNPNNVAHGFNPISNKAMDWIEIHEAISVKTTEAYKTSFSRLSEGTSTVGSSGDAGMFFTIGVVN
jgi:hypothetical protein